MAVTYRPSPRKRKVQRAKYVTQKQGKEILDRQARKYLDMSGDEFIERYRRGQIDDPDRPEVVRVAMLIPLAESN